jgi:DNA-binding transcriptional MerR regulator
MSDKIYNVSKEAAAQLIGVSTRTIDRYISDGKLSAKKVWNKVMLNQAEVIKMRSEFDTFPQSNGRVDVLSPESMNNLEAGRTTLSTGVNIDELASLLDEKFEKFQQALEDKDNLIEDKNKVIFMLQNKVGELETRIKSMIALPDYTAEKQQLLTDKQNMEDLIDKLQKDKSRMSMENRLYLFIFIVVILFLVFYAFKG